MFFVICRLILSETRKAYMGFYGSAFLAVVKCHSWLRNSFRAKPISFTVLLFGCCWPNVIHDSETNFELNMWNVHGVLRYCFLAILNVIHNLETHFERNTWTIYQVLPFCSSDVVEWCNSWLQSVFLTQNGGLLHGCKSSAWVGKSADLRQA